MGDCIYAITEHPETFKAIFREYEIVDSTPSHYHIEPRNIPNKQAQTVSRRVKKDSVCDGSTIAKYYWSKTQAIEMERERQERIIRIAKREIEDAHREIEAINTLSEEW